MYTLNIFLDKNLISTRNVVDYMLKPIEDEDLYVHRYSMELLVRRRFGYTNENFVHQLWISDDDDGWKVVILNENGDIEYNSFKDYVPSFIANANGRDENGLLIYDNRGELIDAP